MAEVRAAAASIALVLLSACYSNVKRNTWFIGDVALSSDGCSVVGGSRAILELYSFRSVPLPFAWGGYRVLVALPEEAILSGRSIRLADPSVNAAFCSLSHGAPHRAMPLEGTVQMIARRGLDISVRLQANVVNERQEFNGVYDLVRQGRPAS